MKRLYSVNTSFSGSLFSEVSSQVDPVLIFLSYVYEDLFLSPKYYLSFKFASTFPPETKKSQQRMFLRTSQRIIRDVLGLRFNSVFAKSFLPRMAEIRTFTLGRLTQCPKSVDLFVRISNALLFALLCLTYHNCATSIQPLFDCLLPFSLLTPCFFRNFVRH